MAQAHNHLGMDGAAWPWECIQFQTCLQEEYQWCPWLASHSTRMQASFMHRSHLVRSCRGVPSTISVKKAQAVHTLDRATSPRVEMELHTQTLRALAVEEAKTSTLRNCNSSSSNSSSNSSNSSNSKTSSNSNCHKLPTWGCQDTPLCVSGMGCRAHTEAVQYIGFYLLSSTGDVVFC